MSTPGAANPQTQQLHDDVQSAVKSLLGATAPKPADYSKVLASTLAVATKRVKIQIATQDLTLLRQSGYTLCFAKKIGNAPYNVVWRSSRNFLSNNTFSWTPQYQLFGSNVYQSNTAVEISTNTVSVVPGQQAVLNESGVLGYATTGGRPDTITLLNNYGPIHPGLSQLSTGIDGVMTSTPIYISPETMVQGQAIYTPTESVMVWFDQNTNTGDIFNGARSMSIEIDLSDESDTIRLYEGGIWKTV